ncbi:MAG: cysteine hydrolase family protein, partial [Candidatus Bipolaricaulota bacterium]
IFWDIDTQKDFMKKDGALYVPGAEEIIPTLQKITRYAKDKDFPILGSVDAHQVKDQEFKQNGGPFPAHCIKGTEGQRKIAELQLENPIFIPNVEYQEIMAVDKKVEEHLSSKGEVFFEKQSFDVFNNPHLDRVLARLNVKQAVLYGVTTDFCVRAAAFGMADRDIEVYVVEDAIKPVNPKDGVRAKERMREEGITFRKWKEIETAS